MRIYDISQEVFSSRIYPGDPAPRKEILSSMEDGALYNLTAFHMCTHNGTHLDAPRHFMADGKSIEAIPLEQTVGDAYVLEYEGELNATDVLRLYEPIKRNLPKAAERLLLKGDVLLSEEGARVLAEQGVRLIGCEAQSPTGERPPMAVHKILLSAGVLILEGLRLQELEEGPYFLFAAPLSLQGSDGAPCRAILLQEK